LLKIYSIYLSIVTLHKLISVLQKALALKILVREQTH